MARRQSDKFPKPPARYNPSPNSQADLKTADEFLDSSASRGKAKGGKRGFWQWQLMWLAVLLAFGVTGAGALLWLLAVQPPPNCQQLSPVAADGERLYCAQQAANSGKLEQILEALALVESWPPEHPLHEQSLQLTGEWSKAILGLATAKIEAGDLQGALEIVGKIPKSSPAYSEVETAVAGWQNNWEEGQKLYDKAQEALKAEDLRKASEYAQALFKLDNIFWGQKRFNELVEQITLERQGWQRLREAKELAAEGGLENLGEAIALAGKIGKKLFAYTKGEAQIVSWSRALLGIARQRLQEKNLDGAIAAANLIPADSALYAEAQDLMQLGRAQAVTWNQSIGTPLPQHIFALLEGQAAAAQIAPDRPLYKQAQDQIKDLEVQFQDLLRLQMASTIASFGQPIAFQLAIDQAQTIDPGKPRRVHAQTLVAYWRKEILRIEDQPYVLMARQLAAPGTAEGLNAAIAQARMVAQGRPLRIEAQTLIAQWTKSIQIVEDQPLLNQAQALAKLGKLAEAIEQASQIKNNRALYAQAQANISQWVSQLQIAQDRPILTQASELAAQGSLSAAISMAAQIGYGRTLYSEAQGAIARWAAERDAISAPPPAAEPAAQYSEPASPQEPYSPPAQQQEPPVQQQEPPAQPQEPPARPQEPYSPPAQEEYSPPPQEEYSPPPQEEYSPPPPQEEYAPPPEPEPAPPAQEVPAPAEPPASPDGNLLPE
ncbi:hypothetical protein PN499_00945 [Kamptonema animale CS-326]|jgi:hypothetical protein|uniref:hypothetical protein n=1 Tax=Kamptonema animale TaxID=92934 RepID=UPI0023308643|nr:hypothetical protein [Kamptonema animale]MDB9509771.1 hypothetical protein [Kamptonema animale CS-326]